MTQVNAFHSRTNFNALERRYARSTSMSLREFLELRRHRKLKTDSGRRALVLRALSASCLVLIAFGMSACSGGGAESGGVASIPLPPPSPPPSPPPPPPAQSVERDVLPVTTDASLTTNLAAHFVVTPDPAVQAENRLFVMLPGTGAIPRFYREIVRVGAEEGYHALGLTYPNDTAVIDLCSASADVDCAGNVRREIITGEGQSSLVDISRDNAITGRFISLLTYLETTYPSEGWGQFLIAGQPNWSRITVAGHSQGAGHAGYFAKLHTMDRIVMFSGPSDLGSDRQSLAVWPSLPNITPASRQYGFTHVADDLVPLRLIAANWSLAGLPAFGPLTSVDDSAPPYGSSRQLTTSAEPRTVPAGTTPSPTHASTVVDVVTPVDAQGELIYRDVWVYLAFR